MSEDAEKKDPQEKEAARSPYTIVFELEGAALAGRQAEYDTLVSLLKTDKKNGLTPSLFIRHCLNRSPASYLPGLLDTLGAKQNPTKSLIEEIEAGIAMFMASPEAAANTTVASMLRAGQAREIPAVALTAAKEAAARGVLEQWGDPFASATVYRADPVPPVFPRCDVWLKLLKSIKRSPASCVALVGSQAAAKSALAAGLRCIAIPDSFTAFQDFSGVSAVIDADTDWDAAELLELVAPTDV